MKLRHSPSPFPTLTGKDKKPSKSASVHAHHPAWPRLPNGLSGAAARENAVGSSRSCNPTGMGTGRPAPEEALSVVSNGSQCSTPSTLHRRRRRPRKRITVTARIVKGLDGFGFTVVTARRGQKVNSIIEADRCNGLMRGDLLLSVNGSDLSGMNHNEIVQLLRQCPEGVMATICVERRDKGPAAPPQAQDQQAKNSDIESNLRNHGAETAAKLNVMAADAQEEDQAPPVPPRTYRDDVKFPTAAMTCDGNAGVVGITRTAQGEVRRPPSAPRGNTSLSGQINEPQHWQQETAVANKNVTTLEHLQQRYFQLWRQSYGSSSDSNRKGRSGQLHRNACEGSLNRGVASAMESEERQLPPPPLPPRPRKLAKDNGLQTNGVLFASASSSTEQNHQQHNASALRHQSGYEGSANLPQTTSCRPLAQDAHWATQSQRHWEKSTTFSTASLPASSRRVGNSVAAFRTMSAAEIYHPHFATMSRQPAKLVLTQAARYPGSVGRSWDQDRRSKTPDGTMSFWKSAYLSELKDLQQRRPASSASGLLKSKGDRDLANHWERESGRGKNWATAARWNDGRQGISTASAVGENGQTLDRRRAADGEDRCYSAAEDAPPLSALCKYQVVELDVTLHRRETGFGFTLVGGPEGGTQVTVGRIAPGGAADSDGSLRTGDEILAVDGVPTLGASHYRAVQLMGGAASRGKVDLRVRRRLLIQAAPPVWANLSDQAEAEPPPAPPLQSHNVVNPEDTVAALDSSCSITLTQQPGDEGFGIVVMTPRQQPHEQPADVKIGQIQPNSPAARCGRLFVGDHILAINGMAVSGLTHVAVVGLIKERGRAVTITVAAACKEVRTEHGRAGSIRAQGSHQNAGSFESHDGSIANAGMLQHQESFLEVSAIPCVGQSCPDSPDLSLLSLNKNNGPRTAGHQPTDRSRPGGTTSPDRTLWPQRRSFIQTPEAPAVAAGAWGSGSYRRSYCQPDSSLNHAWEREDMGSYRASAAAEAAAATLGIKQHSVPRNGLPTYEAEAPPTQITSGKGTVFTVELVQDRRGFGFSVRGGHEFGGVPLCVLRMAAGGAAETSGKLQVGDEILEINGRKTAGMKHGEAVGMIQDAGPSVMLTVRRVAEAGLQSPPVSATAGSPRSSPTGSSANDSNGGTSEKWWSQAAHSHRDVTDAPKIVEPASKSGNELSGSTALTVHNFGSVTSVPSVQRPAKPSSGLLMQAPTWHTSHQNLATSRSQAPEQREGISRRLSAGPFASPVPSDLEKRALSNGHHRSNYNSGRDARQQPLPAGDQWDPDVTYPSSPKGSHEYDHLSVGFTGSLNGSAEPGLSPRATVPINTPGHELTGTGKFSRPPFGFYETLLRQSPQK